MLRTFALSALTALVFSACLEPESNTHVDPPGGADTLPSAPRTDTLPSAPRNVSVEEGATKGTLVVAWERPLTSGKFNPSSLGYLVQTNEWEGNKCITTDTTCVLTGLGFLVPYSITVVPYGETWAGYNRGAWSTPVPYTIMPPLPNPPNIVTVSAGANSITLTWVAGASVGSPETGYRVKVSPGLDSCIVPSTTLTCIFEGLIADTVYRLEVSAKNASGYGPPDSFSASPVSQWMPAISGVTADLRAVASNGTLLTAVGSAGTILTSPDGEIWSPRVSGTHQSLNGVTWAGSRWIAVGDSGVIRTSPDAITWTAQASGITNHLNSVAASASVVLAVGAGKIAITSTNDSIWDVLPSAPLPCYNYQAVLWAAPRFVIASGVYIERCLISSETGTDWVSKLSESNTSGSGYNGYTALTRAGSQIVAVGGHPGTTGKPIAIFSTPSGAVISVSVDGNQWSKRYVGSNFQYLRAVVWNNWQLVAAGTNTAVASVDGGNNWYFIPALASVNGSAALGSRIVVVGNQGVIHTLH